MLREDITIKTTTGELHGYLFVGQDGLPVLEIAPIAELSGIHAGPLYFWPSTLPNTWELQQAEPDAGILFCAWRTISELQFEIAQAQCKVEKEADNVPTDKL